VAGSISRRLLLPVASIVGAIGLVLVDTPVVRLLRSASGTSSLYSISDAAQIGALLLGVGVIVGSALWLRRRSGSGASVAVAAVAATLVFGLLDTPLDWFPKVVGDAAAGKPTYNQDYAGLTTGLYAGLRWIRANTRPDDVLVVNNHSIHPDGHDSKYFYYSAFAERRVVLESWDYTAKAAATGQFSLPARESPFPHRLALSDAASKHADPHALAELRRGYGARYLVADKVHGYASPALAARVGRVFSNGDVDVYALDRPGTGVTSCKSQQGAGIAAVFGRSRTIDGAGAITEAAAQVGYRNLTIQRRGCHAFAVVLTELSSLAQGRQLVRDAAAVKLHVTLECRSQAPEGGLNAVFGHRRTQQAAEELAGRVGAAGFAGLDVRQDRCGDWEVDLSGLKTAAQRREFRIEARQAGFPVHFEPG
jgi:hypothetical protein